MLTEATRFAIAVYDDESNVYTKPIVAWMACERKAEDGTFTDVVGMVYNEWNGLEECDEDTNFVGINFDQNVSPAQFARESQWSVEEPEVVN